MCYIIIGSGHTTLGETGWVNKFVLADSQRNLAHQELMRSKGDHVPPQSKFIAK